MTNTHDIGPLFWHVVRVQKKTPIFHRGISHEVSEPFRSARPLLIRFFRWALVLGWWKKEERTENEALIAALTSVYYYDRPTPGAVVLRQDEDGVHMVEAPEWADFSLQALETAGPEMLTLERERGWPSRATLHTVEGDFTWEFKYGVSNFGRVWTGRREDAARKVVAMNAKDLDEEHKFLHMLGLM